MTDASSESGACDDDPMGPCNCHWRLGALLADQASQQLLAKQLLGLWRPPATGESGASDA